MAKKALACPHCGNLVVIEKISELRSKGYQKARATRLQKIKEHCNDKNHKKILDEQMKLYCPLCGRRTDRLIKKGA
jgi:predicted RNA-binding Zn-ribbon protein involved in translation (DUF1610 family)